MSEGNYPSAQVDSPPSASKLQNVLTKLDHALQHSQAIEGLVCRLTDAVGGVIPRETKAEVLPVADGRVAEADAMVMQIAGNLERMEQELRRLEELI